MHVSVKNEDIICKLLILCFLCVFLSLVIYIKCIQKPEIVKIFKIIHKKSSKYAAESLNSGKKKYFKERVEAFTLNDLLKR